MIKFGRKFFFDKVHIKRNYTIPIIIGAVLLVGIITTFIITRYFKEDKPKVVEMKLVLNKEVEVEIYSPLPMIESYIKEIKNIKVSELEIIYPEELNIVTNNNSCDEFGINCETQLVTSLGEYKITIKSDKLKKDKSVTLKVVDNTAPTLALKEVTITEGETYKIEDFIESCADNSNQACIYEYSKEDKNENEEIIDYSTYTNPGEYIIKIIAKDSSNNQTDKIETKLTINKKPVKVEKPKPKPEPKVCEYGNLEYSKSYVIATKIANTECAISAKEAESISYKPSIEHNKKLVKEIKAAYLKNAIDAMNLEGEIVYDITYGPVYNKSNKGVVGYYLLSEARQTVNGKTTTLSRYYIDENGNKVWKINVLNLK